MSIRILWVFFSTNPWLHYTIQNLTGARHMNLGRQGRNWSIFIGFLWSKTLFKENSRIQFMEIIKFVSSSIFWSCYNSIIIDMSCLIHVWMIGVHLILRRTTALFSASLIVKLNKRFEISLDDHIRKCQSCHKCLERLLILALANDYDCIPKKTQ